MLTEEEKNAGLEGKIIPINIEEQMKSAYIDYSMSVIVSRALPDVRDGLKPVHLSLIHIFGALLILILGSLTLGFAFGEKWAVFGSGWGGAFGVEVARRLTSVIGVLGNIILLPY